MKIPAELFDINKKKMVGKTIFFFYVIKKRRKV